MITALLLGCAPLRPLDWDGYDVLAEPPDPPATLVHRTTVRPTDYVRMLHWGERWFREGGFGGEVAVTDVMGILMGSVQAPCAADPAAVCEVPVLERVAAAIDLLDGTEGNLFGGNGGPTGGGFTSDLVLEFPPGATRFGIPVPERLHTGLDVEAGSLWPIGIFPVAAGDEPWLPHLSELGQPDAPDARVRLRLSCAACHYSLDVDGDGSADLRSSKPDEPTPGSPWQPWDAWARGNTDLHFGWLFGLSANPMLGALVLAGKVGDPAPDAPRRFGEWLTAHWESDRDAVHTEVLRGFLLQPRGWADVSSDAAFSPIQFPTLYTRGAWPSNANGALFDDTDRNNTVWTGALDFTGLASVCHALAGKNSVYAALDCATAVDLIVAESQRVRVDPAAADALRSDITGESDGVPGTLDPDSIVLMKGPTGTLPKEIYELPVNDGRRAEPKDYGRDGRRRHGTLAALGVRLAVPPEERTSFGTAAFADDYGLVEDDLVLDSISVFLDWQDPPTNPATFDPALLGRGQEVFRDAGCAGCHAGPYGTDNLIHRVSADPRIAWGGQRGPSSAAWWDPDRRLGVAIDTEEARAVGAGNLRRLVSAPYDPKTGLPSGRGSIPRGLFAMQHIGYKSTHLRGIWLSAPYLHDGGVAVVLPPGAEPLPDLAAHLRRSDPLWYGVTEVVPWNEAHPEQRATVDAALSLQALVLRSQRDRVLEQNRRSGWPVVPGADGVASVAPADIAITGQGHAFWVDDVPGGPDVTALVAFLLAWDGCPGEMNCPAHTWPEAP